MVDVVFNFNNYIETLKHIITLFIFYYYLFLNVKAIYFFYFYGCFYVIETYFLPTLSVKTAGCVCAFTAINGS